MEGEGATLPLAGETEALAQRAQRVLQHRHHLFEQLGKLCHELTASLTDLAEDDSWVKGQCEAMRIKIEEGLSARGVRAVSDMLHHARSATARCGASASRRATRSRRLIDADAPELAELGSKTGNFHDSVGRYADVIEESPTRSKA